ncbi:MAG: DUF6155 family protein [Lachnoclostridium sp.]|nr:DUF6155 family protein [Lachnoclostridium sp.]
MSKAAVKKAISEFTPEQLRGLILDIYSKYKDAKEFLDFFADPDIEKVSENYASQIDKEVYRVYHHFHAPRITRIKSIIKKYSNLEPGYEAMSDMLLMTVIKLIRVGKGDKFTESVSNQVAKLLDTTCEHLHRNGQLKEYLPLLDREVEAVKSKIWYNHFYHELSYTLQTWIERSNDDSE